jgi:serine protease Do
VAVPTDNALRKLLDQFVCVRLIQMHGVDLAKFQFDYAMTWAIFYMNADDTIYGRYGTRSAMRKQSARDISLEGFKESIQGALELHKRYVADPKTARTELAGKQTQHPPKWQRAEQIPSIAKNPRIAKKFSAFSQNRNERAHGVGCIHCHFVPNHELMSLRLAGEPIAERLIWPYPMPGAVGLYMNPRKRATVQRVFEGSAAAKAGVQPGDEILQLDGQTILSTADMQWVLHNAGSEGRLGLSIRRDGETKVMPLKLAKNWRRRLGDWRFANLGVCMQIAGFQGRPARNGGKTLAIRVSRVHRKRMAEVDLRKNDVVIAIDGVRVPMNLGKLTECLLSKEPGSEIAVTRRRRGETEPRTVRFKIR